MDIARHLETVAAPLFEVVARSAKAQSLGSDGDKIDLAALVEGRAPRKANKSSSNSLPAEIAAILRIPASEISPLKVIREVGLDSLMAMELGMSFRQKTGFEMPLSSVTQSTTVGDVSRKLYLKITQHADTGEAPRKGRGCQGCRSVGEAAHDASQGRPAMSDDPGHGKQRFPSGSRTSPELHEGSRAAGDAKEGAAGAGPFRLRSKPAARLRRSAGI